MTKENGITSDAESNTLKLFFEGGLAENGAILLEEYAASLEGWRDLFQLLGELYLHSFPELRKIRGSQLLRLEITAERSGSYETWLLIVLGAAAGGIIGNRADALAVWSFRKLVAWYRTAIASYVQTKNQTTDITAIADSLRQMMEEQGISLEQEEASEEPAPLLLPERQDDSSDEDFEVTPAPIDRAEALAERLDQSLKHATQPLEHSCERIKLVGEEKTPLLEIRCGRAGCDCLSADASTAKAGLAVCTREVRANQSENWPCTVLLRR